MVKDSRAKTAFVTPFGKYEFLMVPFGLAQAPAYFQLLMNKVLEGLSNAMTYLNDIIIFSKNEEDHLRHLEEVFRQLRQAGLKMKCSKCDFFKSEINDDHFEINLVVRLLNQIYIVPVLPPGYDYDNLHANVMDELTPSTSTGATTSAPPFSFTV